MRQLQTVHLFAGSSHPALAAALAKELGVELGRITLKKFSCGEHYVRFEESVRGKDVYLLQTGTRNPNEDVMELFLMCQAAKLSFARSVHVVLPHFPYARQDRVAEPREAISAKIVAHLLEEAGADHLIVLDLHSDQIQGFFKVPVDALAGRTIFAEYFRSKKLPDPVVVAPDVGGAKRAKKLADILDADLAILHKSRPEHHRTEMHEVVGDIKGKTCILFDDIIDTAGTLIAAKEALLERGANADIYAAATHAVFSGPALERLQKANFKEVIVTDSIPIQATFPGLTVLPIAPLLATVIRHIESGQSVTEIYKN
ncbi:ribose-phosphate pyrophosphokinase [Candidatus Peregrinibacteria bacterium]|nr:ribose-phosphate pyrophosphokinase [Candidatus Peregrinibacteria bacterium]MBI3816235.1 ribose-phosphate pyrophosphokinase [Candidatus Peregrinibacteria bacterium]